MRHNRFKRFLATMLTLVMTSVLITPILAATKYETTNKKPVFEKSLPGVKAAVLDSIKAQDGQTQFSQDELEEMRSALLELVDSNQELSALLSPQGKQRRKKEFSLQKDEDQFAETRSRIQQMSDKQLTSLRKALNPTKMRAKIAASRAIFSESQNSVSKAASDMAINSSTPAFPGINAYCSPLSPKDIIAADVTFFIAEGIRDAALDACNEVIVVLGEGGNGSLACLITDAIYLTAKALNQAIHFCDDDYAQSVGQASFDRLGHIHDDLEGSIANDNANKTDIINNDNANKTTIVNNDNANKTTIVNNDNANALALTTLVNSALTQIISNANANKDEVKNLLLRTQIEADLSSTDGSTFVALYETPSSVCFPALNDKGLNQIGIPASTTQCGLLDLVRSIVSQTIVNGGNDKNALRDFATGDAQRAAGQYKSAYTSYRKAYKTAAK